MARIDAVEFHKDTPDEVRKLLQQLMRNRNTMRVRIWYGDTDTGRSWLDEHEVIGYVGHSIGRVPIPLIIYNARSVGGAPIRDHCIIRIDAIKTHVTLYQHPKFYVPSMTIYTEPPHDKVQVIIDGSVHATFDTLTQAFHWEDFMKGKRYRT